MVTPAAGVLRTTGEMNLFWNSRTFQARGDLRASFRIFLKHCRGFPCSSPYFDFPTGFSGVSGVRHRLLKSVLFPEVTHSRVCEESGSRAREGGR